MTPRRSRRAVLYFGAFSLGSFAYRLYSYGHHLDPHAPMKITPFMPVVIGSQQIANFVQTSLPLAGTLCMDGFLVLLARRARGPPSATRAGGDAMTRRRLVPRAAAVAPRAGRAAALRPAAGRPVAARGRRAARRRSRADRVARRLNRTARPGCGRELAARRRGRDHRGAGRPLSRAVRRSIAPCACTPPAPRTCVGDGRTHTVAVRAADVTSTASRSAAPASISARTTPPCT